MEDVCNYMLMHKEVIDRIKKAGKGPARLLFVMLDEKTEEICEELGVKIALPPVEMRKRLDSKIELTRLASEAGIDSAPNVLVKKANSFSELMDAANKAKLGNDLVVQTPYGDSGRTTFFIKSEADYNKNAKDMKDEQLKIMKRINHMPGTMEVCVTRHGTLSGPIQTDITGFEEITPYKGGWCGNDVWPKIFNAKIRRELRNMASALGDRLYKEGYKGVFCMDFLLDTDDGTPYLGEVNPRISGASPLTNLITAHYGGVPLFLFHLLEYLDVDYEINLRKVQNRWNEYDFWSQLVLKQTEDKVRQLTHAPRSGVWRMDKYGGISFDRLDLDWTNVIDNDEAYYLRVTREPIWALLYRAVACRPSSANCVSAPNFGPPRLMPSFMAPHPGPCRTFTRILIVRNCSRTARKEGLRSGGLLDCSDRGRDDRVVPADQLFDFLGDAQDFVIASYRSENLQR
jgi:biotin carboxylase